MRNYRRFREYRVPRRNDENRCVGIWGKNYWRANCLMYLELEVYGKYVHGIQMVKVSKRSSKYDPKGRLLYGITFGAQPESTERNIDQSRFKCGVCTLRIHENCKHVLFECNEPGETHQIGWLEVLISTPQGMRNSMRSGDMLSELAPGLLVSCVGCTYIREWKGIYMTSLDFASRLYAKRIIMYDDLLASIG